MQKTTLGNLQMSLVARRGLLFVLSSPSGAGKTTITKRLVEQDPGISVSVSVTTRPRRPGEVDGVDYHFISPEQYRDMIAKGELLEHAQVFGQGYGTPKQQVFEKLAEGQDINFDIDWQGAQQLAQLARTDMVSIFILPPCLAELERRLRKRAQDSEAVVQQRMTEAANEMSHWPEYDYVIVNKDIEKSIAEVRAILTAERLRRTRQLGLVDFVNELRQVT
ncbi:MAG: guanylate kinase [Alphaproteobacteria bacterium]